MSNFTPVKLGPFSGGMRNSSGLGEAIDDKEVFTLTNLEVDLDGTLVNRPAVQPLTITGISPTTGLRVLGRYLPNDGRIFLVVSVNGQVRLITASSGVADAVVCTCTCVAVIQYNNKLWVIPAPGSATAGGFFDATSPIVTYTGVAAIPQGEAVTLYKERLFVGCGISSTTNTARVRFCAVGDPLTWAGADNFDVSPGDGEKLVDLVTISNDIIIFKEHSTWRFNYAKLPSQADLSNIDRRIGVPAINCTVVYNSNTVYALHDNAVYELYNSQYERISAPVAMTQLIDATLLAPDVFGLTLFRDRLFVRYYAHLYVYALRTKRWSQWDTTRKFSKIVTVPSASLGLDTAYMHSASTSDPGKVYFFRDDRVTAVGTGETFNCSVQTKVYEFDIPQQFKAMAWGGIDIATSGVLTTTVKIPNASQNNTWAFEAATYTWNSPGNWDDNDFLVYTSNISPALGDYAKKFLKNIRNKIRFRQCYFTLSTPAVASTNGSDSSVKIFDMVVYIREAQVVPKETN